MSASINSGYKLVEREDLSVDPISRKADQSSLHS